MYIYILRAKRQAYHDQISKLENIRGCLVELRDLCKTKDENYRDILDHLGNQVKKFGSLCCNKDKKKGKNYFEISDTNKRQAYCSLCWYPV